MRKLHIRLTDYIELGGKLEKLNWNLAYSIYSDKNINIPILSCENRGDLNTNKEPLYYFTFENGNTKRYALSWIYVKVNFILSSEYL